MAVSCFTIIGRPKTKRRNPCTADSTLLRKRCYIVKSFGQGNQAKMLFQKLEKPAGDPD